MIVATCNSKKYPTGSTKTSHGSDFASREVVSWEGGVVCYEKGGRRTLLTACGTISRLLPHGSLGDGGTATAVARAATIRERGE